VFEITGRTESWSEVLAMGNGNTEDDVFTGATLASEGISCRRVSVCLSGWLRGPAVEHWSLADVLSLSCARLVTDG